MATRTRLPNKTIASLTLSFEHIDAMSAELREVQEHFQSELAEAKLNMDKRRQAKMAEATASVARIAISLSTLERILSDARRGQFNEARYPRP